MRVSRLVLLAIALAALAACGRGGSSGLDIAENAVITSALTQQKCLPFRGLTICPADQSGGTSGPRIDTALADATTIDCFQATPGGACTFTLDFVPRAFPDGTTFKVLGRANSSGSPWILGGAPTARSGGGLTATVELAGNGGPPPQVQLAVLAFAAATGGAAGEVDQLHDTAATSAFVTHMLTVTVVTPTRTPTPTGRPTNTATATATPGESDCCQCAGSCAAPIDGSCGDCPVVFGASCFGGQLCAARTPTPTASPTAPAGSCLTDNGDGTVGDRCTGLTWEKKEAAAGLHDYAITYPWAGVCNHDLEALCQPSAAAATACADATSGAVGCAQCPDGMVCVSFDGSDGNEETATVWSWLAQLNNGDGFGGHTDWRLPSVDKEGGPAELETILLPTCGADDACVETAFDRNCETGAICGSTQACSDGSACVHPPTQADSRCEGQCTTATCSCTWPQNYWSTVTDTAATDEAWYVDFSNGSVGSSDKMFIAAVRAVRGQATPLPTRTPGANDCCQCASSCAAPVDGSCGTCTVAFGMTCGGADTCVPPAPTPTPTSCLSDNGDGTVSDACRGLRWEKKDRAGGLHDVAALYTWAGSCSDESKLCQPNADAASTCAAQTGGAEGCDLCASGTCVVDPDHAGAVTTIWEWVNLLNAQTFAGFNDWRIPTVGSQGDVAEIETLCTTSGSVPSVFSAQCTAGCSVESCSCTQTTLEDYWSATTVASQPGLADGVSFVFCGSTGAGPKTNANSIRAVRRDF